MAAAQASSGREALQAARLQGRPLAEETEYEQPWSYIALKVLLWALLQALFAHVGFGIPFFVVACLYGMWAGTSQRQRLPGQKSAYSVFNEGCEAIDGSLDAEEMTRQMLYGPAALAMAAAKKKGR